MAAELVQSFLSLSGQVLAVYEAAANHHVAKSRLYLEIDNWRAVMIYAKDLLTAGVAYESTTRRAQHVVELNSNLGVFVAKAGFRLDNYTVPGKIVDRPRIRLDRKADIVFNQVTLIREELKTLKEEIEQARESGEELGLSDGSDGDDGDDGDGSPSPRPPDDAHYISATGRLSGRSADHRRDLNQSLRSSADRLSSTAQMVAGTRGGDTSIRRSRRRVSRKSVEE